MTRGGGWGESLNFTTTFSMWKVLNRVCQLPFRVKLRPIYSVPVAHWPREVSKMECFLCVQIKQNRTTVQNNTFSMDEVVINNAVCSKWC